MSEVTTITLTLSEEERAIVEALAAERGVATHEEALHALLRDVSAMYDALWDKTFADSLDVLEALADEAHTEYLAGRTEEFDPDTDHDAV